VVYDQFKSDSVLVKNFRDPDSKQAKAQAQLKPLFAQIIKNRVHKLNKNSTCLIIGETGCLSSVTKIWVDGEKKCIGSAPEFFVTKAFNGQTIIDTPAILNKTGVKRCVEIEFESGKKVVASREHRWLSNGVWKQTNDLVVGDKIATAKRNNTRTNRLCKRKLWQKTCERNRDGARNTSLFNLEDCQLVRSCNTKKASNTSMAERLCEEELSEYGDGKDCSGAWAVSRYGAEYCSQIRCSERSILEETNNETNKFCEGKLSQEEDKRDFKSFRNQSWADYLDCSKSRIGSSNKVYFSGTNKLHNYKLLQYRYKGDFKSDWIKTTNNSSSCSQDGDKKKQGIVCGSFERSNYARKMCDGKKNAWELQKFSIPKRIGQTSLYQEKQGEQSCMEQRSKEEDVGLQKSSLFGTSRIASLQEEGLGGNNQYRKDYEKQVVGLGLPGEQGLLLQQSCKDKFYMLLPRLFGSKQNVGDRMRWKLLAFEQGKGSKEGCKVAIAWLQSPSFSRQGNIEWEFCEEVVVGITECESVSTFDLTVPEFGNYVLANGLLSHNSGKSYAAARLGELLDPPDPATGYEGFSIKRVAFDTEEFLKILKDGLDKKTLRKGSVIVYDEMGISHSNRNFQDSLNKALNFVFQGFRRENLIVFMTVPKLKFVDLQIRELMHFIIVPKKIDFAKSLVWCKGYIVRQNPMSEDSTPFYTYKAKVAGAHFDGVRDLEYFGLGLPSNDFVRDYEEKKKIFMFELYEQAKNLAHVVKRGRVSDLKRRVESQSGEGSNSVDSLP